MTLTMVTVAHYSGEAQPTDDHGNIYYAGLFRSRLREDLYLSLELYDKANKEDEAEYAITLEALTTLHSIVHQFITAFGLPKPFDHISIPGYSYKVSRRGIYIDDDGPIAYVGLIRQ